MAKSYQSIAWHQDCLLNSERYELELKEAMLRAIDNYARVKEANVLKREKIRAAIKAGKSVLPV